MNVKYLLKCIVGQIISLNTPIKRGLVLKKPIIHKLTSFFFIFKWIHFYVYFTFKQINFWAPVIMKKWQLQTVNWIWGNKLLSVLSWVCLNRGSLKIHIVAFQHTVLDQLTKACYTIGFWRLFSRYRSYEIIHMWQGYWILLRLLSKITQK